MPHAPARVLGLTCVLSLALGAACGGDAPDAAQGEATAEESMDQDATTNRMIDLLASGQPVFGIFAGDFTAEQGALMGANREIDFIFYSLENGPFDLPTMGVYMDGLAEGAGADAPHPIALRIPPIRDGRDEARERVRAGLQAGAQAIVFPHTESAADVQLAVEAMGTDLWPMHADGAALNVMLVEDQVGIAHAREIVGAPGVSVAIPGPGDLRRAYDGDMEAVENAIQTVLAACKEFDVPCGITAGVADIGERLNQGFRFIIVTAPEALAVGLAASGRSH